MPRDHKVYLDDILQGIERIKKYTQGLSFEQFASDFKTSDAVVRNLEIIGEAVKHIPEEVRAKNPQIEWRKIGALRDILAHEYFGVDFEIIWDVVINKIPELELQLRKLL